MNVTLTVCALVLMWPFSSAKHFPMTSGAMVPAATGTVKVQKDKNNGNTRLDIKVDHLANPSGLTPSENTYIVWIRPNGADAVKEGAIQVNHNLSGEIKVVTVSKNFEVLITAEQSNSVNVPSNTDVLRAHVSLN